MVNKETYRHELRAAIGQLSERCLYNASKWAAEQLVGIEQDPAKHTPSLTRFQRGSSSILRRFRTDVVSAEASPGFCATPIAGVSYVSTPMVREEENDAVDSDFYLLAKSYFDCKEYRRAAHVLRDQTNKKAVFLRCYAIYLQRFCCSQPNPRRRITKARLAELQERADALVGISKEPLFTKGAKALVDPGTPAYCSLLFFVTVSRSISLKKERI